MLSPSVTHTGTNNLPGDGTQQQAAGSGVVVCRVPTTQAQVQPCFSLHKLCQERLCCHLSPGLSHHGQGQSVGCCFPSSCPALNPSQFRPRQHRDSPRKNKRSIFPCQIPRGCPCRRPCLLLRPAPSPPFRRAASDQASSRTRVYPLSHPQGRPPGPLRRHRCHGLSVRHHH